MHLQLPRCGWEFRATFNPRDRSALTLVELLIVVAIMAILIGTLFPVLQMARESARRSACSNNLRQIALAMMTYGDSQKVLPGWRNVISGYSNVRAEANPREAAVSWTVPILAHIEQDSVHQWYTSYTPGQQAGQDASQSRIRTYRCPSQSDATTPSPLSYAVNAGTGCEVMNAAASPASQYEGDGVFSDAVGNVAATPFFDSSRPIYAPVECDIKTLAPDGTSMTIMVSERSGPDVPTDVSWSANPHVPRERRGALSENHSILHPLPIGSGWRTEVRVVNPTAETRPLPAPVPGDADMDDWNLRYPSSRHPRIVNAAFCDGHVRKISEQIDVWVYCQLLSSNTKSVSAGVADWQQYFTQDGSLAPYSLNPTDLDQ